MKWEPLNRLRERVQQLPSQDRRALLMLLIVLASVALWQGAWRPVAAFRAASEAQLATARTDAAWMAAHADAARQLAGQDTPVRGADRSLLAVAGDSAAAYHLALTRAEPGENDTLTLSLEKTAFSRLLAWLEALHRDNGVDVQRINMTRQEGEAGRVNADLTMR